MEQPYGPPLRPGYNMALASVIVGAVGLVGGCCVPLIGIPAGIVAIVLGVMGLNAAARPEGAEDSTRTMAIIGIVLGALTALIGILGAIWSVFFLKHFMKGLPGMPGRPPGM